MRDRRAQGNFMKKKTRNSPNRISPAKVPDPPWLHDDPDAIRIPCTEEELDKLVGRVHRWES